VNEVCGRLMKQSSGSVYAGSGSVSEVTTYETGCHAQLVDIGTY